MPLLKKILIGLLIWESRLILSKYKPFVVAVTGSVGKTSTKDAIYEVLKQSGGFVRKSEKSMNSDIGLPLTIIGAHNAWYSVGGWINNLLIGLRLILKTQSYPNCLILEVGADHPGDIKKIAKWLRPHIAVLTRISRTPVHVEFFKSPDEVFEEKAALARAVRPDGSLVMYGDDDKMIAIGDLVKDINVSIISYGLGEKASIRGKDTSIIYGASGEPTGMTFCIVEDKGATTLIRVNGIVGETYIYPFLAAYAVGKIKGATPAEMALDIERYDAPKGRMNLIPGINGSTLVDDTYNSSPDAVSAGLSTLSKLLVTGSKIAVLGDMMELGKFAATEHRKVGAEASKIANLVIAVGQRSKLTAEEAIRNGMSEELVKSFATSKEAASYLRLVVKSGDIVFIKGSQSMRMERVTAALLREPEKAATLLVRQEREWLVKP